MMTNEKKPNYEMVEQIANDLVNQYLDFDGEEMIPVARIAYDKGLEIIEVDFSDVGEQNISGVLMFDENQILINQKDGEQRKRFTIAHELGHYLLHNKETYKFLLRDSMYNGDDWFEKEANHFAACLLVPKSLLYHIMEKYLLDESNSSILANFFGVSESMMNFRLLNLKKHG